MSSLEPSLTTRLSHTSPTLPVLPAAASAQPAHTRSKRSSSNLTSRKETDGGEIERSATLMTQVDRHSVGSTTRTIVSRGIIGWQI